MTRHTKCPSFTARTTRVSNPVCSPSFRASASRNRPGSRLRHWCSSRYLRISPLHREFHYPLPPSSRSVSDAVSQLSRELSHRTKPAACARFTPSKSGQRLPPTYYRGCWHVVSRGLFLRYRLESSLRKEVYNPKAFVPHAELLPQTFVHWAKFPTAASRRSLGRSQSQSG